MSVCRLPRCMVCQEVEQEYGIEISIGTNLDPNAHPNHSKSIGGQIGRHNFGIEITAKRWQI